MFNNDKIAEKSMKIILTDSIWQTSIEYIFTNTKVIIQNNCIYLYAI